MIRRDETRSDDQTDCDAKPTQLALIRFSGDLGIKARATRRKFQHQLIRNLKDAISSQGSIPRIRASHDRAFAEIHSDRDLEALTRVFGVQSVSLVERRTGTQLRDIVRTGEDLFRERVRGRRFAVRAAGAQSLVAGSQAETSAVIAGVLSTELLFEDDERELHLRFQRRGGPSSHC